jgi:hypothetical protein
MTGNFYVATDSNGIEHSSSGHVEWVLPGSNGAGEVQPGHPITLRQPIALIDFLDARIFTASSNEAIDASPAGTVEVMTARLVEETKWDIQMAARFALNCAEHLLIEDGEISLPSGTPLQSIIADARTMLDDSPESMSHLEYFARVRALRRLKHGRKDIADLSLAILVGDEMKDVDALDDPEYESLAPITDAVLAAIEAVRHFVLPHLYTNLEDAREERIENRILDGKTGIGIPSAVVTPFGNIEVGAPRILEYEPAWTSAREAARHARLAVKDRSGSQGELNELKWQSDSLELLLTS